MKVYNLIHMQNTDCVCDCDVKSFVSKQDAQNAMRADWQDSVSEWGYDIHDHYDDDVCECGEDTAIIRKGMDVESWRIETQELFPAADEESMGTTKLRRTFTFSSEEIDAMYQRNENFRGKRADFNKLRLFQEIKADLTEFLQYCDDVQRLEDMEPNQHEKNAMLFLDMNTISMLDKKESAMLTAIMDKADRVIISAIKRKCIRFSFGIENVWMD